MILTLFAAAALMQPAPVLAEMEAGPEAMLRAEVLERPAGTSAQVFIAALAAEAGASGWQRVEQEVDGPPARFMMTGYRNPAPGGSPIVFYSVAGEDPARVGRVCRVRLRERPGPGAGDEVPRISQFCLGAIAPQPLPLPTPQR